MAKGIFEDPDLDKDENEMLIEQEQRLKNEKDKDKNKEDDDDKKGKEDTKKEKRIEKEDEDDDGVLKRDKKDKEKQKGKEDSIQELRKLRDEEREARIKAEKEVEELKKVGNVNLSPVAKYIESKFGGLDDDAVKRYIEKNKLRKQTLTESEKKLAEKEAKLRHYTIEEDSQFQSQYKKPYHDAAESLLATIAPVDKDGNIIKEDLFKAIRDQLIEKSGEIDPIKAKGLIANIAAKYKEVTGEDYNATTLSDFIASIREVNTKKSAMQTAYKNWETEKTKAEQDEVIHTQEEREKRNRAAKSLRKDLAKKAVNSFDYESLEGVIDEEKIESIFSSVYKRNEEIFEDASKLPSYDTMLTNATKAELFDEVIEDYKRLKALYNKDEDNKRQGLKGSDKGPLKSQSELEDDEDATGWMTGK